jgi:hypothetical protein
MRRGIVIVGVLFVILAAIGIGVGVYHAGEARGVAQQIATTADGAQVVHVVDGDGYGWGRGGFFPFGLVLVPLFVVGTVLLVRAALWRGGGPWRGGWGPGGPGPNGPDWPGFGSGGREAWLARAEAWHRSMHEGGAPSATDAAPRPDPSG